MLSKKTESQGLRDWLTLLRAPGLGPVGGSKLLRQFGSPSAILRAGTQDLRTAGIGEETARALRGPDEAGIAADMDWLAAPGHHLLTCLSGAWPPLLAAIADPPLALFVAGDPDLLSLPQLAIVGSRNPSASGKATAREFAAHLARAGLGVTSGLATGIDAAAHRGALDAGGVTVAVMGTGPEQVYPSANRSLAAQIAATGAIVTEFPSGTPPLREHFPRRNRIISGLALGTLVVEAAIRSGSLITARNASEQGREVFAIPGSIHNPMARGCHRLIRDGAKLVESANDVFEELVALAQGLTELESGSDAGDGGSETRQFKDDSSEDPEYSRLREALGFDPVTVDALVARSGLTAEAVSSMLLILELGGEVESAPGGKYVRTGRRPARS